MTHEYIYDGDDLLYERITEAWGPGNPERAHSTDVIEVMYTRGPGGEAISRRVPNVLPRLNEDDGKMAQFKTLFYHLNRLDTPVAATDSLAHRYVLPELTVRDWVFRSGLPSPGGPPWVYWFSSYMYRWRSAVGGDQGVDFHGQPYDPETGLHYFRNRYYDAQSGRFTQEDPIGLAGGLNLYAYANSNPVNFTDPFGLCPPEDDEPCSLYQRIANWGAKRGYSAVVNLASGTEAFLGAVNVMIHGEGCSDGVSCGSPGAFIGGAGGKAAVGLAKQLASEAQMAEKGTIFAGGQSGTVFRDAAKYAEQYGGKVADWVKKRSTLYKAADGTRFETHWVENLVTGLRASFKTVFR